MKNIVRQRRIQRAKRSRANISGTESRPRLCVNRSNRHIHVQLIDDGKGITIAQASTREVKAEKQTKVELAKEVGELIAKRALEAKIKEAVFDRRFYKYHGRVKAVAEGAREAGLKI